MKVSISSLGAHLKKGIAYVRSMSRVRQVVLAGVLLLVVGGLWYVLHGQQASVATTDTETKSVSVSSVAALASGVGSISLTGTVTSQHEATLRAETNGGITQLYRKLGDTVGVGQVIAEFENSSARASVLQAEGAYEAALAGGSIAGVGRDQTGTALANARTSAYNTLHAAFATFDDAVHTKTDVAFSNPRNFQAAFVLSTSNSQIATDVARQRVALEHTLSSEQDRASSVETLSDSALSSEMAVWVGDLTAATKYLDTLSLALNQALPTSQYPQATIDAYRTTTSLSRTAVQGALSSVVAAKAALDGALSAASVAAHQSGSGEAITTSSASIKQALGVLRAAQANLEHTIVRSPINGTIISLPVSMGDYATLGTVVATVSNNAALEVVTYVNEDDARTISVGGKTVIDGSVQGVITRIASAIDPLTKKIEVRVGIVSDSQSLTNGSSVRVELAQSRATAQAKVITLPIASIKMTAESPIVFTVENGVLVPHQVAITSVSGDRAVIGAGVTQDMMVVVDARGLKAGQRVVVGQ